MKTSADRIGTIHVKELPFLLLDEKFPVANIRGKGAAASEIWAISLRIVHKMWFWQILRQDMLP